MLTRNISATAQHPSQTLLLLEFPVNICVSRRFNETDRRNTSMTASVRRFNSFVAMARSYSWESTACIRRVRIQVYIGDLKCLEPTGSKWVNGLSENGRLRDSFALLPAVTCRPAVYRILLRSDVSTPSSGSSACAFIRAHTFRLSHSLSLPRSLSLPFPIPFERLTSLQLSLRTLSSCRVRTYNYIFVNRSG